MRAHGTRSCYVFGPEPGRGAGCRCEPCAEANRVYARFDAKRRSLRRSEGRFAQPYVDATPAREHLAELATAGVGRRQVALLTGMAQSVLSRIRSGEIRRVRRDTAGKILGVSGSSLADRAIVDAGPTWKLVEELLAAGVTKKRIGEAVTGNAGALALQISRDRVTRRTAERVAALHLELVLGGPEPERGTAEHFRWWRAQQRRRPA